MLFGAVSCDWFELDNQEGWNAKVQGQILDAKTGKPVQSEQGSSITIVEKGWDQEANQSWLIKNDGTYVNNLVFAGDYVMRTVSGANFMADETSFTLKKGDNTVNFTVTPFIRILNPSVTVEGTKIKATFSIEAGSSQVNNVGNAYLCIYPDRFVKRGSNNASKDPLAQATNLNPDGTTQYTLYIDTQDANNSAEFQYDRPHYIRIAAVGAHYGIVPEWKEETQEIDWDAVDFNAPNWWENIPYKTVTIVHPAEYTNDGSVNVSNAYNYSPVYKLENGTITEVTDW